MFWFWETAHGVCKNTFFFSGYNVIYACVIYTFIGVQFAVSGHCLPKYSHAALYDAVLYSYKGSLNLLAHYLPGAKHIIILYKKLHNTCLYYEIWRFLSCSCSSKSYAMKREPEGGGEPSHEDFYREWLSSSLRTNSFEAVNTQRA